VIAKKLLVQNNYGKIGNNPASYLPNLSCELLPAPLAISFAAAKILRDEATFPLIQNKKCTTKYQYV